MRECKVKLCRSVPRPDKPEVGSGFFSLDVSRNSLLLNERNSQMRTQRFGNSNSMVRNP